MSKSSTCAASVGQLIYFGKLPCRGDFVRSPLRADIVASLDDWQSRALESMSADPRWKLIYDAAPELLFVTVGTGRNEVLAGHWQSSQDASGRRFPFITAAAFEWAQPRDTAALAPMMLAEAWAMLATAGQAVRNALEHSDEHANLHGRLQAFHPEARSAERTHRELLDFLDTHTVSSMEQMLAASGTALSLRQAVLALGLLLQPALTRGAARLSKVLRLPLVRGASQQTLVASWWMLLVLGFFQRHELDVLMCLDLHRGAPHLLLGFQGLSAPTFEAMLNPHAPGLEAVCVAPADWVEAELANDVGLRKLSTYLSDPGLSLRQAMRTYQEVFLGA